MNDRNVIVVITVIVSMFFVPLVSKIDTISK